MYCHFALLMEDIPLIGDDDSSKIFVSLRVKALRDVRVPKDGTIVLSN